MWLPFFCIFYHNMFTQNQILKYIVQAKNFVGSGGLWNFQKYLWWAHSCIFGHTWLIQNKCFRSVSSIKAIIFANFGKMALLSWKWLMIYLIVGVQPGGFLGWIIFWRPPGSEQENSVKSWYTFGFFCCCLSSLLNPSWVEAWCRDRWVQIPLRIKILHKW